MNAVLDDADDADDVDNGDDVDVDNVDVGDVNVDDVDIDDVNIGVGADAVVPVPNCVNGVLMVIPKPARIYFPRLTADAVEARAN